MCILYRYVFKNINSNSCHPFLHRLLHREKQNHHCHHCRYHHLLLHHPLHFHPVQFCLKCFDLITFYFSRLIPDRFLPTSGAASAMGYLERKLLRFQGLIWCINHFCILSSCRDIVKNAKVPIFGNFLFCKKKFVKMRRRCLV